jgi:hypothetical protein
LATSLEDVAPPIKAIVTAGFQTGEVLSEYTGGNGFSIVHFELW